MCCWLLEYLLAPCAIASAHEQQEHPSNVSGFLPTAKWKELECNEESIYEANRQYSNLLGPTVPTGEAS